MNKKSMNKATVVAASLFLLVGISHQALAIVADNSAAKTAPGKLPTKKELRKIGAKTTIGKTKLTKLKKINAKNIKPINGKSKKIATDKLHKPKKQ